MEKLEQEATSFYKKYSRFMVWKLVTLFSIKTGDILPIDWVEPLVDIESKTYFFTDKQNVSYAVMVILWDNWEPIDYKAWKIIEW